MFSNRQIADMQSLLERSIEANHVDNIEIKQSLSDVKILANETAMSLFGTKALPGGLVEQVRQNSRLIADSICATAKKNDSLDSKLLAIEKTIDWYKAIVIAVTTIPTAMTILSWYFVAQNSQSIQRLSPKPAIQSILISSEPLMNEMLIFSIVDTEI